MIQVQVRFLDPIIAQKQLLSKTHREFCVSGSTFRSAKIKSLEVPPFLVHYCDMLLLGTIMKDDYISYHFYAYDTQLYLPIYHHFL